MRVYSLARTMASTAAEWDQQLGREGVDGRQLREAVSYELKCQQHAPVIEEADDAPLMRDASVEQLTDSEWRGMVRALRKMPKRRAVPSWGVKAELLFLATQPWARLREGMGAGAQGVAKAVAVHLCQPPF